MLVCMRELLKAARTYYVRTDGSDSNDGLANTAAGAFLTIQRAVDVVLNTLDFGGFNVTIQVGDGTYTAGAVVNGPQTGLGLLTIQGNATTPGNVVISVATGTAIVLDRGAVLNIRHLELRAASGSGLQAFTACRCTFLNLVFGACGAYQMQAGYGARIVPGDYTITGGALSHLSVAQGGSVYTAGGLTVTLTGTPNFSVAFLFAEMCGTFRAQAITFTGAATGKRYAVETCGAVQTYSAGPNYFPGSTAGTAITGGVYV